MNIGIRNQNNVAVADIAGDIKGADSTRFMKSLEELIKSRPQKIGLNFGQVTFVDSSGLGALVSVKNMADKAGLGLSIFNISEDIKDLFHMTQLNMMIKIHSSEAEALN